MNQSSYASPAAEGAPHALQHSRELIRSLKARQDRKRNLPERIADWMTSQFGTMGFLLVNFVFFAVWITLNVGIIPGVQPFDPFPFALLTMIVSLEAIALAIVVLISQNRASRIADLREEVDLQVDMLTEREITRLLQITCALAEKLDIDVEVDEELQHMLTRTSFSKIEHALERQVIGPAKSPAEPQS